MKKICAILMLALAFVACGSDEDIINEPQQPVGAKTYTMTVQASKGGDTRALAPGTDPETGKSIVSATWTEHDAVTVYNLTKGTALEGTLKAQGSGSSTTLKGDLTGEIEVGNQLQLKFLSPSYASQDGTLAYIAANCDYATATVTVNDKTDNSITTTEANFDNQQAIVKFTLKNKAGDASLNTNSLRISDGTHTYTVNRSGSANPYYVAIPGFNGKTISMIALDGGTGYEYTKSGVSFTNGQYYEITVKMANGHAYVDLGLPSGTLWATCNVGATTPEGYGDYIAWGETTPKQNYAWSTYKFDNSASHDGSSLSKYTGSDYSVLKPEDDAARQNWGSNWRMATSAEWAELVSNTDKEWTTIGGVQGGKFMKKTDHSVYIFLPAGGLRDGTSGNWGLGTNGRYWSSSLKTDEPIRAYMTSCDDNEDRPNDASYRYFGRSIRPVLAW